MAIVDKQTDKNGNMWGWDDVAESWVELDAETEGGNVAGNLFRGAKRGFEGLGLGIQELGGQQDVQPEIADLGRRSAAAGRRAPIAEAVGGAAPDILAALGVGAVTGGAGFGPMLAAEAGGGALMAGLRPGDAEDRLKRAALGAGLAAGGAALGGAAASGISRAVQTWNGIAGRSAAKVEGAIQRGAGAIRNAERQLDSGGAAEANAAGGRSVGAAETPSGSLGDDFAAEGRALEQTDAAGGGRTDAGIVDREWRPAVEDMGYRSPAWAGSRGGSSSRIYGAVKDEWTPTFAKEQMKADNQKLIAGKLGEALGLGRRERLEMPDLADAEATIGMEFQQLETQIPNIGTQSYADAFKNLAPKKGSYGKSDAEKRIASMVENVEARGDSVMSAEDIMTDRSRMSNDMAKFYKNGEEANGEKMREAIDRLDNLVDKVSRRQGRHDVADRWQQARSRWQIYRMASKPGVLSPQGDINPVSLRRAMAANKSSGGFGKDGPRAPELRDVWKLANVAAADETGLPNTGARLLARGSKAALPTAGVLGGLGGAANLIWGN